LGFQEAWNEISIWCDVGSFHLINV
jgi:hypothetical protein